MPADMGMAFVVVTHLHPGHASMLPELLGKTTVLPVLEVRDGMKVEVNRVYVEPPGGQVEIRGGRLHRIDVGIQESPHLPIDHFFRSLADDQKENAICIILSGTGSDGTLGLRAIKGESGMAMVQQVQSAKYSGMPGSAIATGLADFVLDPAAMPAQLTAYGRNPHHAAERRREEFEVPGEPMQKIFALLHSRTGNDFSGYKTSTLRRRIERRMNLQQIEDPNQYVRFLEQNPHETDILFKELLISVTSFFRDPEAFESLEDTALPALLKSRTDGDTLRIWVPGCASGEEAFSIAIVMREAMNAMRRTFEVQIFGTDLDSEAIDTARTGIYPEGIALDVPPKRLERYFVREGATYRIRKDIREMTIFALQNVIKDPPFTKLDLISCRNLLIYLHSDLQKRLLPVFHYALKPGGLLFLGPSETIGGCGDFFDVVDKKFKIFRRKELQATAQPSMGLPAAPQKARAEAHPPATPQPSRESNITGLVDRLLLARFAPASVVVNNRGDVIFIHGRTGEYLEPAAGQPRLNIHDMARESLKLDLSLALREAATKNGEVSHEGVEVRTNGDFKHIDLMVTKIAEPEALEGLFLVTFRPSRAPVETSKQKHRAPKERDAKRVKALEHELKCTRESLQITIEELETSNEELKSMNEELQSANEELQSSNEELETSREEMQSLNQELTTVNTELHSKVEEFARTNDDMQNLLNGTEIATLYLDRDLKIKRYTEHARHLVNLIPGDIGRPLGDLASNLNTVRLVDDCSEVLRTLVPRQAEVQTRDGHWYYMRILPYRTAENLIGGLVLTFVDVNPLHEAQKGMRRMAAIIRDSNDAITVQDFEGRITAWNHGAEKMYGWSEAEALQMNIGETVPGTKREEMKSFIKKIRSGEAIDSIETQRQTKDGRVLDVWLTITTLVDETGRPVAIATTERDITNRKQR